MTTTPKDPFEAPATGDFIDWDALDGALILFTVHDYLDHVDTKFSKEGEKTHAIKADVAVLDNAGELNGVVYEEALIFGRVMVARLRPRIGAMVLTRPVKVATPNSKWGKKSYQWDFKDFSEDDAVIARKWITDHAPADPFDESA